MDNIDVIMLILTSYDNLLIQVFNFTKDTCFSNNLSRFLLKCRESHVKHQLNHELWLNSYIEIEFYKLFRMKKNTFNSLLSVILDNDTHNLIKKKFRGGRYPTIPEKSLLIFLWYMSKQDTLLAIADRFGIVSSTTMQIVNAILYIVVHLKNKFIIWPNTQEEIDYTEAGFTKYPGVLGAIDGTYINLKVPSAQHDSYIDRYQQHSINLMAVCNADKVFTYTFIGFPGSAHDSRVLWNSLLVQNIERYGANRYFKNVQRYHLIGDSAFPIREWLITPYKEYRNLNHIERHHNYCLSSERVCIENAFAKLKGRWKRLTFINTYHICKAIEITTAACVLHNFCILNSDEWTGEIEREDNEDEEILENDRQLRRLGVEKRERIARQLIQHRQN